MPKEHLRREPALLPTSDDLREAFSQYGTVSRAQVVQDRETGRSRGFGFVEMDDGGDAAIDAMNGAEFQGRTLTVNEARPREPRAEEEAATAAVEEAAAVTEEVVAAATAEEVAATDRHAP